MNIIVFHWKDITHPYAGGAERLLHSLMKKALSSGHSVIWFCSQYPNSKATENVDGIKITRRGGQFSVYLHAIFFYLRNMRQTSLVIDNITGIPWFTPLYSSKKKIAIVYHLGKKETFFTELPAMMGRLGYFLAFIGWRAECLVPCVYKQTPIVTFSEDTRSDLVAMRISQKQIYVVQEGIDLTSYQLGKRKFPNPHIIYVGRLVKNKGVEHLISALSIVVKKIPDVTLSIVGAGPFETKLKQLTLNLGLSKHVVFHGYVSEEEKVNLLQKAQVLVHPSLREGWATPVIEANACGTPSIGANVTGINCTIQDGVTGFLFEYGNTVELANVIMKMLTDKKIQQTMRINGLAWAKKFDKKKTEEQFIKILNYLAV